MRLPRMAALAAAVLICACASPALALQDCSCADCAGAFVDNCCSCDDCSGGYVDCGGCGQCGDCCGYDNGCYDCGGYGCDSCCGSYDPNCHGCYDTSCNCGAAGVFANALAQFDGYGYCGPKLAVKASWIYLRRDELDNTPLITQGNAVLASASNFDFNYQPGMDISTIYYFNDCWSAEARYLRMDTHSARAEGNFPATASIANTPPAVLGAESFVIGNYDVDFQSAELNLRRRVGNNLWVSLGSRWMEFNEEMRAEFMPDGGGASAFTRTTTHNDLYGLQLGVDGIAYRSWNGFTIDGFFKAGIYANEAESSQLGITSGGATFGARDDADEFSLISEAGLFASYPINCVWSVRGGYQVMWLSGIAVAGDQTPQSNIFFQPNPMTHTDAEGDAFYHGINAGLHASW